MTVKECYEIIGDYNDAMDRLMKEDLIVRFLKKFETDKSYTELVAAYEADDIEGIFSASHTLKGVAANLSLTRLYSIASEITELYRDRQEHDMGNRMEILEKEYVLVMETINHLD